MTADQIRAKHWEAYGQPFECPIEQEIAAQLAEANELKRLEVEAINNLCEVNRLMAGIVSNLSGTINLLTHEGSPLSKLAAGAESVAVSLDILVNRGRV